MLQRIHSLKLKKRRKGRDDTPLPTFKPFVVVPTEKPTVYKSPSSVGSLSSFTSRENDFPESLPPTFKPPEATKENNPLTIPIHKPTSSNITGRASGRGSFRVRPSKDFQLSESSTTQPRTSLSSAITTAPLKRPREERSEQYTLEIARHEQFTAMQVNTISLDQQSVQSSLLRTRVESIHSQANVDVSSVSDSRRSVNAQELDRLVSPTAFPIASPTIRSASVVSGHSVHSQQRRSPSVAQSVSRKPSPVADRRSPSIANSQVRGSPVADKQILRSPSMVADEQVRRSVSATLESTRNASPLVDVEREKSLSVVDESKGRSPSASHSPDRKSSSPKRSPSVTSSTSRHSPAAVDLQGIQSAAESPTTTPKRSPTQRAPTVSLEEQEVLEHSVTDMNIADTNVENDAQENQDKRPETSDEALARAFDVDMGDDIDYTNYADPEEMGSYREASVPNEVSETANEEDSETTNEEERAFNVDMGDDEQNDRETSLGRITDEEISARAKDIAFTFQTKDVHKLMASKLGNLHVNALHQLTSEAARSARNLTTDPFVRSVAEDYIVKLFDDYEKCHADYNEYLKITTSLEKLGKFARSTRSKDTIVERERMQIQKKENKSNREIADLDKKIEKLQDLDDFWDTVRDLVKPTK